MTSIDEAARRVADAEQQRARAEALVRATVEAHGQAQEALADATRILQEAHAQLIEAVYPPLPVKVVKRPAQTADQLLDLDDVGGR